MGIQELWDEWLVERRTVFPSTDKTRFLSPPPHRWRAASGVIKSIFCDVGSRAAMFSGVFSAVRPVLVIKRISGKERFVERMNRVPLDM